MVSSDDAHNLLTEAVEPMGRRVERLSMKIPVEQLDVKLSSSAGRWLVEPVDKIEQLDGKLSSSAGRFPVELHTCCDSRTTGCSIND